MGIIKKVLGFIFGLAFFAGILQILPERVQAVIALLIIVLAVVAVVLIIRRIVRAIKERKERKENTLHTQTTMVKSEPTHQPTVQPRPSVDVVGERLYTDVRLFHPSSLTAVPDIGDEVIFAEDPENPYDAEAVAARVLKDGEWQTVAYFNRNRLRDMVRDWLRDPSRGEIYAEVTKIEPRNVTVDITFKES